MVLVHAEQVRIVESAWALMCAGASLKEAATAIGIDPKRLDRGLWRWRSLTTNSKMKKEAA